MIKLHLENHGTIELLIHRGTGSQLQTPHQRRIVRQIRFENYYVIVEFYRAKSR